MSNARHEHGDTSISRTRRLGSAGVAAISLAAGVALTNGCLERPLCTTDCSPRTTNLFIDSDSQHPVDKIDLLFMIDNSNSMADKQDVFKEAVPDLVDRLVNPVCVDEKGNRQPVAAKPGESCLDGFEREFEPVNDIHVGVITSSLGGHGGNQCSTAKSEENDDHAHLIGSLGRFGTFRAQAGETTQNPTPQGFLDWSPAHDLAQFEATFKVMTVAADEHGCGFEASLESIHRFLSDPAPPAGIVVQDCGAGKCGRSTGVDQELLDQRKAFLRPDSLVAVILLSDENDCSLREDYGFNAAIASLSSTQNIASGSSACATNPNDRCCYSCASGNGPPDGCPPDPVCSDPSLQHHVPMNLACYEQKRRLGYDFLYPTSRYVNAFTRLTLCTSRADLDPDAACPDNDGDGKPDLHENDLLSGHGGIPRDPSLVYVAGIVGVPWQDLRATTVLDDSGNREPVLADELRYKTAEAIAADGTWDRILGKAAPGGTAPPIPPLDQLMVERPAPRGGEGASGAEPVQGPSAARLANSVNGHEWTNADQDDLQYACIFALPKEQPCQEGEQCDCPDSDEPGKRPADQKNPLCQAPDGSYGTTQYFAKAYPGLRELEVLKGVGAQAVVASICPRQLTSKTSQSYGYRPAVDAIVDRLKKTLQGRCLPRKLQKDETGKYPCSVVEASPAGQACDPARGRTPANGTVIALARKRLEAQGACGGTTGAPSCDSFSYCNLQEAGPECHDGKARAASVGWCYVDPDQNPSDDPELVAKCPASARHILRFIDPVKQTPASGAKILIACSGAPLEDVP